MKSVIACVGTRPGDRTLLLINFRNERLRDQFRGMVDGLMTAGQLPTDCFVIASNLAGHGGETLLVLPPMPNRDAAVNLIARETALQLSLQMGRSPMSGSDYAAYSFLAQSARASDADPRQN